MCVCVLASVARLKVCQFILIFCMTTLPLTYSKNEYKTYYLDDPSVCSGKPKTIFIGGYEHKTYILLKFSQTGVSSTKFCHLEISAPYNHHLGVAIEEMDLRKKNSECVDYIQFLPDMQLVLDYIRDFLTEGSGFLCGQMSSSYDINNTYVYLGNKKIKTLDFYFKLEPMGPNDTVNFTVAITAYRNSKKKCLSHEFDCGNYDCIYKELICDGHVNCAFDKGWIGLDETFCENNTTDRSFGLPFGSTIGMVAIIILAVVGMITGAWCCTKASHQSQERSMTNLNSIHTTHEDTFHNLIAPSAPPSYNLSPGHIIVKPEEADNMPPSYESLFPGGKKTEQLA